MAKATAENQVVSDVSDQPIMTNEASPTTGAPVEAEAAPEVPTMHDLKGIRYIGSADVKILTANDLASQGVVDPKGDLQWDASNGHFVDASQINASTRDWLATQPDFAVM